MGPRTGQTRPESAVSYPHREGQQRHLRQYVSCDSPEVGPIKWHRLVTPAAGKVKAEGL